jgi:hypothetical protein
LAEPSCQGAKSSSRAELGIGQRELRIPAAGPLFLLKVGSFPSLVPFADPTVRVMVPKRWFEEWLYGLPFLLRCVVLSVLMLSGAGVVIAVRVAAGHISSDLTGLVPVVFLAVLIAVVGAVLAERKS